MLDRVLHQRLQQQHRDRAVLAGFLYILGELQPRAKSHLLHLEIAARQRQFLAERNDLALAQAQAAAQEVGELDTHFARPGAVHA